MGFLESHNVRLTVQGPASLAFQAEEAGSATYKASVCSAGMYLVHVERGIQVSACRSMLFMTWLCCYQALTGTVQLCTATVSTIPFVCCEQMPPSVCGETARPCW